MWGFGFRVWGFGCRVWGFGFRVWGLGVGFWGLGLGVWGLRFGGPQGQDFCQQNATHLSQYKKKPNRKYAQCDISRYMRGVH